jgi:adenylate kinase
MGAPGVGKGSFGKKISKQFNVPLISTGDIVRDQIARNTSLGQEMKSRNDKGQLIDDELVTSLVEDRFLNSPDSPTVANGYLLDGFPRTAGQAELFDKFADEYKVELVISLNLPEDLLVEKACARRTCEDCGNGYNVATIKRGDIDMKPLLPKVEGVCDDCGGKLVQRADDTEEIVSDRLAIYNREAGPLLEHYEKQGIVHQFHIKKGMEDVPELLEWLASKQ